MKQTNQQESYLKSFTKYVADPTAISSVDSKSLEKALEKYPYCQLLHLFYTRSLSITGAANLEKQQNLTALTIPDRKVLLTLLTEPEKLQKTQKLQYIESVLFGGQDKTNLNDQEIDVNNKQEEEPGHPASPARPPVPGAGNQDPPSRPGQRPDHQVNDHKRKTDEEQRWKQSL